MKLLFLNSFYPPYVGVARSSSCNAAWKASSSAVTTWPCW